MWVLKPYVSEILEIVGTYFYNFGILVLWHQSPFQFVLRMVYEKRLYTSQMFSFVHYLIKHEAA